MGAKFKIGDAVKQVVPVAEAGHVRSLAFNGGDIQCEVVFPQPDGSEHTLYVDEDKLEAA